VSDRLLRARDVAQLLDVSVETVLRWHRSGKLPGGHRITTNALRWWEAEILGWLEGTRVDLVSIADRSYDRGHAGRLIRAGLLPGDPRHKLVARCHFWILAQLCDEGGLGRFCSAGKLAQHIRVDHVVLTLRAQSDPFFDDGTAWQAFVGVDADEHAAHGGEALEARPGVDGVTH